MIMLLPQQLFVPFCVFLALALLIEVGISATCTLRKTRLSKRNFLIELIRSTTNLNQSATYH